MNKENNIEQYNLSIEFLKNIKREDIYVSNLLWESYKDAIETKVEYEILKEKELKK